MAQPTVFVTYNPGNDFEQTLAVRLHTLGAVHGFNMLLPDRFNSSAKVNQETLYRINHSDYFLFFSTSKLAPIVLDEITVASQHLKDRAKIIIIYNKKKNLTKSVKCTEVYIDAKDGIQTILTKIIDQLKITEQKQTKKKEDDAISVIGGILLVGLGLMALDSFVNSK